MSEIISIMNTIPVMVWSGFVAATAALAGVLVSNSGNNKRLKLQLKHDSQEKNLDRITAMRREVYLKAAEDMTRANSIISDLPNRDLMEGDICSEFHSLFASCAKVQLIAESDTALKVSLLVEYYGMLLVRLMSQLTPLQGAKLKIKIHTESREEERGHSKRLSKEIALFQESARSDANILKALIDSRHGHDINITQLDKIITDVRGEHNELLKAFNQNLMIEAYKISKAQIPALVAFRKDLGMHSDVEMFAAQLEASNNNIQSEVGAALSKIS